MITCFSLFHKPFHPFCALIKKWSLVFYSLSLGRLVFHFSPMSWTITKYHRLGGLNNGSVFGGLKTEIKVPAGSWFQWGTSSWFREVYLLISSYGSKKGTLVSSSSKGDTNPIMGVLPTWPNPTVLIKDTNCQHLHTGHYGFNAWIGGDAKFSL
jgi:hypothetical protein